MDTSSFFGARPPKGNTPETPELEMAVTLELPQVAVSRDGERGIAVDGWWGEFQRLSGRFAAQTVLEVRLRPRAPTAHIAVRVSDDFHTFWDQPRQALRWEDPFSDAWMDLAVAAIGEYLDENPIPAQPQGDNFAAEVWLMSELFELFKRAPEQEDARLLKYVGGKLLQVHRFGIGSATFGRADSVRFGVAPQDFDTVAFQGEGQFWERSSDGTYRALPTLLSGFRAGFFPGQERPSLERVDSVLDKARYPAAARHLSKAIGFLHGPDQDLENAAKEAVNAVESVAMSICDRGPATLGAAVAELRKAGLVSKEIARIIESLYVYRNATPGVGHGSTKVPEVPDRDARLVADVSAAAIQFLDRLRPEAAGQASGNVSPGDGVEERAPSGEVPDQGR
jgi:hypothetical protein